MPPPAPSNPERTDAAHSNLPRCGDCDRRFVFPARRRKINRAQKHAPHVSIPKISPRAEDVSTLDGIVKAYYEVVSGPADRPRQWDRDATLYIPNVRFIIIRQEEAGKTTAQSMTHQEFVDSSDASLRGK